MQPSNPGSLMQRLCSGKSADCTKVVWTGSYCDNCQKARNRLKNAKNKDRYGADYKRARAEAAILVATGTVKCARCPGLIATDSSWSKESMLWDLDHIAASVTEDGTLIPAHLAPSHARCNRQAGQAAGAAKRGRR